MPYTLPTLEQFRTKFPTFAGVAGPTITAAIQEASASVGTSWIEADYQPAILYMAAHLMTLDGALFEALGAGAAGGLMGAGLVTETKVGDAQVKLGGNSGSSGGSASSSGLSSTPYGLRYRDLLKRNQPAVALV
ncbi:MAG TPA: DUF4054 domain-containing protein [Bosea sp. (in: a-proteobacteria)]|jgi:hypothetical protein|uniref:DUF4054 domain-containing protein n=1 Tax=Bosea sp. (in: a-proteobacteria) TaxID=1871050 RepID=UPI002E10CE8A|nr:DUF4054 domain-containing protein [Bosea sp. (in: a-proteobacteria)]